jgi:hypothetical protein
MADKVFRLTNGVSFGARYTVTDGDATAEEITFIFKGSGENAVSYPIVANIIVTRSGVNIPLSDAVITYPANGTVKLESGASNFTITADDVISIVAQRADIVAE